MKDRCKINLIHADNMKYMRDVPDNHYELAIVDPPYGGGQHFNFRFNEVYKNEKPTEEYFKELFRISKNQIVWGANYFTDYLPVKRCWISWYKGQPIDAFSDFELAWTTFDETSKGVKIESYGFLHADKKNESKTIHPTQKPVALYEWLLSNYAMPGDKIIDTHGGSMSIAIACWNLKFDLDIIELDKDYFIAGKERFEKHKSQLLMF